MKRRRSLPALLLLLLGIAAQLAAVLALMNVDARIDYAVPAPTVREALSRDGREARAETGLEERIEALNGVREALGDGAAALSMSGVRTGAAISYGGKTATATLTGVEARWLETCPRQLISGRWMDAPELKRGAKVVALDEDLAFELFSSEPAEGREIAIEGERYQVIGVLRHRRSVGDADQFSAYLPLLAVAKQGLQLDTLTMHALGAASAGLGQSLENAARDAWGPGQLHDLRKERMGALLMSRLLVAAFGLALAFRLGRLYAALVRRWRAQLKERTSHAYLRSWLGMAILRVLGVLLGAALLLVGVYAILSFAIEPVYRFTEWVPESLVSLKAIRTVFWSRVTEAAKPIFIRTTQSARITFWGALDCAGAVAMLLGLALGRGKVRKDREEAGNQSEESGV